MKITKIILVSAVILFAVSKSMAQEKEETNTESSNKVHAFHIHQHVMVTMKGGTQVEAVIHSHMTKKKYWVRQWHSGKEGGVKAKYIRAMSEDEITKLKAQKKKK